MIEYHRWEDVPDHLKTKTQLNKMGLRVTKGQKPEAVKNAWWEGKIRNEWDLYNVAEASPKRRRAPLTEAQQEILAAGRRKRLSCPKCGEFKGMTFKKHEICMECADKQRLNSARRWAEGIMEKNPVFLDTETTGLGDFAEIVEIAIVGYDGQVLMNTLIKPTYPMGEEVMGIHGITNEMVVNAPSFADIWGELKPILQNNFICIYNASFDLRMIWQSAEAVGIKEVFEIDHECAMELFAEHYGEWSEYFGSYKWQSLGTAAYYLNIEMPDAHRAHADAETTRRVVMKLAEMEITMTEKEKLQLYFDQLIAEQGAERATQIIMKTLLAPDSGFRLTEIKISFDFRDGNGEPFIVTETRGAGTEGDFTESVILEKFLDGREWDSSMPLEEFA